MLKNLEELVSTKVKRDTIQKAKVLAAMERETLQNWFEFMVDRAYEATVHNKGRKIL